MQNINGKKVKINVDKFKDRNLSNRFKRFIEDNKDKVFTAILDIDNKYTCMYILKEDESEVKWLFFVDDLVILE